jgi:conjugal transfer/entry exclusion protein
MKPVPLRSCIATGLATMAMTATVTLPAPAYAQFGGIVYDPTNYSQNLLTAARTLEQINNQIRALQNQAASLVNEARNLQSLPMSMLDPLQAQIRQTQQLLGQAKGIAYDVQTVERDFGRPAASARWSRVPRHAGAAAFLRSKMHSRFRQAPSPISKAHEPPCKAS